MMSEIQAAFIRPLRQTYYPHDLGPEQFPVKSQYTFETLMGSRIQTKVLNKKNHAISISFIEAEGVTTENCVIYLHTHHGSKLEGINLVQPLLGSHINVCLFDFGGYGNSEGDTVTLGIQQADDIEVVIAYLIENYEQNKFILWGRSMGAVAAILYLSKNPSHSISAAIFDSPFSSLQKLTLQLGTKNLGIPQTLLKPFVFLLKKNMKEKIDFENLQLIEVVKSIKSPGLFIASKEDRFISHQHSEELYKWYAGQKQLVYIEKDHNQPRKREDLSDIFNFIINKFGAPIIKKAKRVDEIIDRHFRFVEKNQSESQGFSQYFHRHALAENRGAKTSRQEIKIRKDHLLQSRKPVLASSLSSKVLKIRKFSSHHE